MNVKIQIHDNHLIEGKLKYLDKWKIPETTKKEINEFVDKAKLGQVHEGKQLKEATISKYLSTLKHTLEIINKPTSKITKEDIERLDKKLIKENLKSIANYRIDLKCFLKWKLGAVKENKIAGWLDTKRAKKTPDYLSEREINQLFKYCKNPSEKYLISVLFDTGARAEEFLNIRYEDIQLPEDNENYVKITLKEEYSKTAGRVISLYWKNSLSSVRDFLEERKKDGIKTDEQIFKQSYDSIRFLLLRLGKKVLNKKIYPHLFRHSSATHYASKLNRQQLCYRYGWKFSSEMPDVYISRAGMNSKELDEKFQSTDLEEVNRKLDQKDFEIEQLKQSRKEWAETSVKLMNEITGIKKRLDNKNE